jgi:membrane protein implicated in regulation of membrane protease activity
LRYFWENCLTYGAGKRGETLKHVIFTIIAFILAIPILLILPVGLSWSGKIAALIIALLLSLLSLVAKSFFPMWQLVLLLGLLMVAMTYLLHRQFAHVFYAANKMDDDELEEQDELIVNTDVLHEEEAVRVNEEIVPQNVSQKSTEVEQDEIITVDELPLEIVADIEQIEQIETTAEQEFPWENEKNPEQIEMVEISELPPAVATDEKQDEDVTESDLLWETVENDNTNEADNFNEWPLEMEINIERNTDMPFDELPPTITPDMEENLVVVSDGTTKEMAVRDGEENQLHISPEEPSMLTKPLAMEENEQPTEIEADRFGWDDILSEKIESKEAASSQAKQSFSLENEKMPQEKVDGKAQEAQIAGWNDNEWPQENESDLGAKEQAISASLAESFTATRPVQSEILQTIVTELQLNRKYMGPLEYEQRIIQCLQTPLPDYDYYVFACLLIEHYLLEKQYDKLASLLAELKEKFHSYPIIQEEIQFLTHTLQKL